MLTDLGAALAVVFLAELGDKSNLLALALAARHPARQVLAGVAAAAATMLGLAVLVGGALGAALPREPVQLVGGLLFVGFAVWTARDTGDDTDDDEVAERGGGFLTTFATFLVAEFGDKTMLATLALATTRDPVATWLGATAGMVATSALAVALGAGLRERLPARAVRLGSAALFLAVGIVLLVGLL
ncbi:MAG: TMEM165/GDT1 family protein [Actinomycetes bacterium]